MPPSPAHPGFAERVIPFSSHRLPMDLKANKQHLLNQPKASLNVSPHIHGNTECKQTQERLENVRSREHSCATLTLTN